MRTSSKDPYLLLAEKLGYEIAEKLMLGEPVTGELAWEVKDIVMSSFDYYIAYEDEELSGESECYAVVALIEGGYALSLIKIGEHSQCKLAKLENSEEAEELIKRAEKELSRCR